MLTPPFPHSLFFYTGLGVNREGMNLITRLSRVAGWEGGCPCGAPGLHTVLHALSPHLPLLKGGQQAFWIHQFL